MEAKNANGDKGITSLAQTKNISKSDARIELLGTLDELLAHLGLVKTRIEDSDSKRVLEKIQGTLLVVKEGVSDPYNKNYRIQDERTEFLEEEIDTLRDSFRQSQELSLPGKNSLSAQIDLSCAVARRAERTLALVSVKFGSDNGAKKYLNRLADYLYTLARFYETVQNEKEYETVSENFSYEGKRNDARNDEKAVAQEAIVREVLKQIGMPGRISLDSAKKLIEKIEEEAKKRGTKAVIAVCGPDGNPVAVHVMDGAFLVSFDVATKKAYTSVAVKMSTMELGRLAQPGGTFYGVDKLDGGRIVIFGGGVPLKVGDTIIGGLGISGGTGEEDHSLAEYGLSVLPEVL